MSQVVDLLKSKNIAVTVQRTAILEYLMSKRHHPTVDDIYHELHQKFESMSKMTVYNNLQTLVDVHLVQEMFIDRGKSHYDAEVKAHHHFYCGHCKTIYDLDINCPVAENRSADGHIITHVQAHFYGTCKKCLDKK